VYITVYDGRVAHKIIFEVTYNVSSGTLNPTILSNTYCGLLQEGLVKINFKFK